MNIYKIPLILGEEESVALIGLLSLIDEDTKDHNWACMCKRCKVWKLCCKAGIVEVD
jgi:hypothetical protein